MGLILHPDIWSPKGHGCIMPCIEVKVRLFPFTLRSQSPSLIVLLRAMPARRPTRERLPVDQPSALWRDLRSRTGRLQGSVSFLF